MPNSSTPSAAIEEAKHLIAVQKAAFLSDLNPPRSVRVDRLNRIEAMLNANGPEFTAAISGDFGNRPDIVTVMAEI